MRIETPSWAYGNSGTRFKVFGAPGVPRNPYEKIADAAQVHALTGLAPRVSLHIPWDRVDDYAGLATFAKEHGVAFGRPPKLNARQKRIIAEIYARHQMPGMKSDLLCFGEKIVRVFV